jgi:hypothetical protein
MAKLSLKQLGLIVDELGGLKADISDLCEREDELKALLIKSDRHEINGSLFRATVTDSVRITMDQTMIRTYLTPKQLKKVEKSAPCTTVRVVARTP